MEPNTISGLGPVLQRMRIHITAVLWLLSGSGQILGNAIFELIYIHWPRGKWDIDVPSLHLSCSTVF